MKKLNLALAVLMLLSFPLMAYNMQSLKINQYYDKLLFEMYYYTTNVLILAMKDLRVLKMINNKDYIMLEGYNSDEKEKRYFKDADIIYSRYIEFNRSYLYLFFRRE